MTTQTPLTPAARLKSIFSGSVGNLVEWYDWYIYTTCSVYFAKAFFPLGDPTAELLSSSVVFAVGFLVRPIGATFFGKYADKHGRKAALIISVLMMCGGSLLIAFTPVYATIGIWAPILLVFGRLLQGLSLGGEYGTSATYLSEVATAKNRGFYSSFQYVTLIMGQLTAQAVVVILQRFFLTEEELNSWGWRIPFVIGAILAIVALYLRRSMVESESFQRQSKSGKEKGSLRELARHPRAVLTVIGLTMGGTVAFYTFTNYMVLFLENTAGFSKQTAALISAGSLFICMLLQPMVGALSDRIGRRPILIAFGVLGTFLAGPILYGISIANSPMIAFGLIVLALVIVTGYTSINAVVKAELFPVHIRALGVGLPFSIAVSVFGGTAPAIALAFKQQGIESGFYWYVTACIACSLIVYATMKDTKAHSMIDKDT
jgi:MHS family alpha-ketoglutarate permease-like MFS transporter